MGLLPDLGAVMRAVPASVERDHMFIGFSFRRLL
jgi:hypothetical protein